MKVTERIYDIAKKLEEKGLNAAEIANATRISQKTAEVIHTTKTYAEYKSALSESAKNAVKRNITINEIAEQLKEIKELCEEILKYV